MESTTVRRYVAQRWRVFADSTTLHGVKQIHRAPVRGLKFLWAVIVFGSSVMMFYQIITLTHHYLTEPVTTTVSTRKNPYPVPLFLFVAHTRDLFPYCAGDENDHERKCPFVNAGHEFDGYPVLDFEAWTYGRSLLDFKVFAPRDFNFLRAKAKFESTLRNTTMGNGSSLAYYDILSPYMTDVSNWIETGGNAHKTFRVTHRSSWSIATYYMVQPAEGENVTAMHHDFQIETQFKWANLSITSAWRRAGSWVSFVLTSYGLLTDAIRFEPGRIIKIRFDLQSHRSAPLRRKTCQKDTIRYKMYDEQKCNETCYLKAMHKWMPRTCYTHKQYEWGFYEMYKVLRPCSSGYHYISEQGRFVNVHQEESELLPGANPKKMVEERDRCLARECVTACEVLEVKVESSSRDFTTELGNKSLLYVTWPAVNAVTVYEVSLQYTWDGFVGQLGGLVGLWMGASTMSLIEAFYLCCCCCYDVRKPRGRSLRKGSTNAVSTSLYRSAGTTNDEEWKYGCEYNQNGNYHHNGNKEELKKLKTTSWISDETARI